MFIIKVQVPSKEEYLKQVLAETLTLLRTHCCIFAGVKMKGNSAGKGEA